MQCPNCSLACESETYHEIVIQVCPKCKGVWLDKQEMAKVAQNKQKAFRANEVEAINRLCGASAVPHEIDSRSISCPQCGQSAMKTFNYKYSSGVTVDRCPAGCGFWLDADEVEKVQMYFEEWQDKLEANRGRFSSLAMQVDENARATLPQLENAPAPSRFRLINAVIHGLVRF